MSERAEGKRRRWRDWSLVLGVLLAGAAGTAVAQWFARQGGLFTGAMAEFPDLVALAGLAGTAAAAVLVARRQVERRRRRAADHARRAAERKFHEVVEHMAGAVTVFGPVDGGRGFVVWDMNAAAMTLVRGEAESVIGRELGDVFGERLHDVLHAALQRVWGSGRAEKLPPFSHESGGVVRWFGCNVFRLGSGEIVAVCNDLTAQKEIEQEARQARADLEFALDASRVGLWTWDLGAGCARIDRRAAAILDVGTTEVLQPADLTERIPIEDQERLRGEARVAIAHAREFEMGIQFTTRDGALRRLCVRARPAVESDGAVRKLVGCVWDATQSHNEEEARQQRQRLESLSTLAAGVAHDLNNALAPLTMGLDLLRLRHPGDAESVETLQALTESTRRATAIVKRLGGLSRGSGEVTVAASPRRILQTLRSQLMDSFPKGIVVEVRVPADDLAHVAAGARSVHQVLLGLCVNARDAMRGRGGLTVDARALHIGPEQRATYPELPQGAYVAFVVQDTGPGVPEAIRDRIFEPFFTTKENGLGSGLGLATALSVIRTFRGTIRFENIPGHGARFSVIVPVAPERVQVGGASALPAPVQSVSGTLRGKTVLLADDETMVRDLARRVLASAGLEVLVARDGAEAVEVFKREQSRIDVVVMDLVMPIKDGAVAGTEIRELSPDVPILGASGYAGERLLERARAAGFTSFLPKPYTMDELLEALRASLARLNRT